MFEIVEDVTATGRRRFSAWFNRLDPRAAAKVKTAIHRMEDGNFGDVKPVGGGVSEIRLAYGPGYHIYFGRDGRMLVVLLGGGAKSRQSRDIKNARTARTRRRRGPITSNAREGRSTMGLTRPFIETARERAARDPEFRAAMLTEAVESFLDNDVSTAKKMLRDYINATIGFQELAGRVSKKPESLMRMLSAKGNPRAENLAQLISSLRDYEGVELHVAAG